MDPRSVIVARRLEGVDRIIAVAAGKGGVGKSTIAAGLALLFARQGRRVGLLDLDFCGPSTHVILGPCPAPPREDRGIVPPEVHGIRFMSLVHYAGDRPTPLRGLDVSNALVEMLAVTIWGKLDLLVVDMPPGMGDTTLDAIRLLGRASFLVVTTPSRVALETVKKLVTLLTELEVPTLGVVENMGRGGQAPIEPDRATPAPARVIPGHPLDPLPVRHLGSIPYDEKMEEELGDPDRLLAGSFGRALASIAAAL